MAKFLTTSGTSYHIENIIINAKAKLVLVSPYLQISKTFYERLKDACGRKVSIIIIYGKDELKPNEKNSLAELKTVELHYFENLHAKCYFNESEMVITSMNMYEFSEKNNREMGVLIDRNNDKEIYDSALREVNSILQSSERTQLNKTDRPLYREKGGATSGKGPVYQQAIRGYCIRCGNRIDYDPARPYCYDCYMIWAQFENPDYPEAHCHRCGEFETTTMSRPQCYECFADFQKELASGK